MEDPGFAVRRRKKYVQDTYSIASSFVVMVRAQTWGVGAGKLHVRLLPTRDRSVQSVLAATPNNSKICM